MLMEKPAKKIFILDDDEHFISETGSVLRDAGFEVMGCTRVAESLSAIQKYGPDCLILDLKMPLFNGHDFLPWLRCNCPDLPVIICTGFSEVYPSILKDYGVRQVLYKPFGHEVLFEAIHQASSSADAAPDCRAA